jgi:sulfoxide reductase heme-binding subunit YedZ
MNWIRRSRGFNRFFIKPLLFLVLASSAIDLSLGIYLADLGPDAHETLLHDTGKWGLIAMMCTLAVSPLAKILNWPLLANLRRMCGLFVAFYATAHIWVYVQFILGFDWSMIISEVIERPYITVGFIAWLLLLPLAVTSNNYSMRRLGRRWKSIHRLTYVIAVLVVWHFAWQTKLDLNEPMLYILLTALLLGWRQRKRLKISHS